MQFGYWPVDDVRDVSKKERYFLDALFNGSWISRKIISRVEKRRRKILKLKIE